MGWGGIETTVGWVVGIAIAVSTLEAAAVIILRKVWPEFGIDDDRTDRDLVIERLRDRYARGEIDEAEFERRRSYLDARGGAAPSEELPSRSSHGRKDP